MKSEPFAVGAGLRQGCVLSPHLFIVNAPREFNRQPQLSRRGCRCWNPQGQPFTFCERLVLLASSEQDLIHALGRFSAVCTQAGTKISTEKTEVLWPLRRPKSVYATSKRRIIAAGQDVQAGMQC